MRAEDAYAILTEEGRRKAVAVIAASIKSSRVKDKTINPQFIRQVLLAKRSHPCGPAVSRAVAAYFRGYLDIDMTPEEVTGVPPDWVDLTTSSEGTVDGNSRSPRALAQDQAGGSAAA